MGEAFAQNSRPTRLQEPNRLAPLESNDDELERAQARAAARRRRSSISALYAQAAAACQAAGEGNAKSDVMDRDQILELYQNCIRLASENKINQKNTWELGLIDHLSEVIQGDTEEDTETNFQKASCTLEAGVKIYSLRVDSVHAEAYKVLGGINRAGRDDNKGDPEENEHDAETAGEEGPSKKDIEKKQVSAMSTLESSFEALNVKKFDVAFTVDPLYHQTTAKFDEGGAKGLLLYNLGVYGGCHVLFDSFEVPEKCGLTDTSNNMNATIDLSFAKEPIEEMMLHMSNAKEISPTLKLIIEQFDEDNQRPSSEAISSLDQASVLTEETINGDANNPDITSDVGGYGFADSEPSWDYSNDNGNFNYDDDRESVIDESPFPSNADSTSYQEGDGEYMYRDQCEEEKLDSITAFLSLGLGFSSKNNAWAGPDHWKFRKVKDSGSESSADVAGNPETAPRKIKSKRGLPDIDFSKVLEKQAVASLFAPPRNLKSLLLPANRTACSNRLPEDCHYRPDSLVKLFLLPDTMCLGRKGRKPSGEQREGDNYDDFDAPTSSWDNDDVMSDNGHEFGNDYNMDEPGSLLRKPRQVNKIDIKYDKVSKQVDVHALKNMLWGHIQEVVEDAESEQEKVQEEEKEATVTLSGILHQFPNESPMDISPHLFFICLLHLANEHGLALYDRTTLDEIDIVIPSSSPVE
ncbi:Condensin complex subunit 2 [Rhynchospora pubera]|uniref:Condensin complex subunit 2 n=1 Tax=Rhynchospora pubera TaxID=906938 RepID=A0AAV8GXX7_9POAL|nr:Condensin complex subunit 2 [Rhynchospora pubera]